MHINQEKLLHLIAKKDISNLSLREIGEYIGEKNPQNVKHHLLQLQKKGLIDIDKLKKTYRISKIGISPNSLFISIPVLGTENQLNQSSLEHKSPQSILRISKNVLTYGKVSNLISVRVAVNTNNRPKINGETVSNGDYVIIAKNDLSFEEGKDVLADIEGKLVIRKIKRTSNKIYALTNDSNNETPPIFIHSDDLHKNNLIKGKVIQVLRSP